MKPNAFRFASSVLLTFGAAFAYSAVSAKELPGPPNTVVAEQAGASVTLDDLDAFAATLPDNQRAGFFDSPTRIEGIISRLLIQKQLAKQAQESGLANTPIVRRQLELAQEEALSKARTLQFRKDLKIPDFSRRAQEDYLANKQKYVERGILNVQHILIEAKDRTPPEARALAETVRKEAVANPADFDALVAKYSEEEASAQTKGLVTQAGDDKKYVAEFVHAAKALKKVGDISPVVQTPYGFHVLKLVERTPDRTPSFAEVKNSIIEGMRNAYIEEQMRTFSDGLRNQPMDASPELVGSLRSRYANDKGDAGAASVAR